MRHYKAPIYWRFWFALGTLSLGFLITGFPQSPSAEADDAALRRYQSAKSLQSEGKATEAVAEFRQFLALVPNDAHPIRQGEAVLAILPYQTEAENQALIRTVSQKFHAKAPQQARFLVRVSDYYERINR